MFRAILGRTFFWLIRNSCFFVLVPLYRWLLIKERHANGSESRVIRSRIKRSKTTILALAADGFRGDLEELAAIGSFRVLRLNRAWQTRLISCFYSRELQGEHQVVTRHYKADKKAHPELYEAKRRTQEFMAGFLSRLYKTLPIKVVLLYNVRYLADLDWAEVSKKLGVVYLVIFREGLILTPEDFEFIARRHRNFGRFKGDHIIVANLPTKRCFIEPEFATEDQITVGGTLRMDTLIGRIRKGYVKSEQLLVTMFWWNIHRYETKEFSELTMEALEVFTELAREMKKVKFVIKPKPTDLQLTEYIKGKMRRYKGPVTLQPKEANRQLIIENVLTKLYPEWHNVGNLTIEPWADVHDLILQSSIVCAFDSTTLFESGLAGKPIVIPYFDNFRLSAEGKLYKFRDFLDVFDVAKNKTEFKKMIEWRLSDGLINPTVQDRRRDYFSNYVSDLSGTSAEKTKNLIIDLVAENGKSSTR